MKKNIMAFGLLFLASSAWAKATPAQNLCFEVFTQVVLAKGRVTGKLINKLEKENGVTADNVDEVVRIEKYTSEMVHQLYLICKDPNLQLEQAENLKAVFGK